MSISSDTYEQREYELFERIKLLEEALREIREISNVQSFPDDWDWLSELMQIDYIIEQIPNLTDKDEPNR